MSTTQKSNSTTNRVDKTSRHVKHVDRSCARAEYHIRFYESDTCLARIVAEFLHEGFAIGNPAIVVATADQRTAIVRELTDRSLDVVALQRSYDLVLLDAQETLTTFMTNGKPDTGKFNDCMRQVIERVCRNRPKCTVRIFGQMVDVLCREGNRSAAIGLEMLWNQFPRTVSFSLLCGYVIANFYKDAGFGDFYREYSQMASADDKANRVSGAFGRNQRQFGRR